MMEIRTLRCKHGRPIDCECVKCNRKYTKEKLQDRFMRIMNRLPMRG